MLNILRAHVGGRILGEHAQPSRPQVLVHTGIRMHPHFRRQSSPYIALEAKSRRSADAKETHAAPGKDLAWLHARRQAETPAMTVIASAVH